MRHVAKHITIGAGRLGFYSRAGQIRTVSPTARHRRDVSSELCCTMHRRKAAEGAPPLVTGSRVMREGSEDFF